MCLSKLFRKKEPAKETPILPDIPVYPEPTGVISLHEASSILLDKFEDVEIYLPDEDIKVYNKEEIKNFLKLDETDKIPYLAEIKDCDDSAAIMFGKFAGLVWTSLHALNFFISDDNKLFFIEPQTDLISQELEGWQGKEIRFFLSR